MSNSPNSYLKPLWQKTLLFGLSCLWLFLMGTSPDVASAQPHNQDVYVPNQILVQYDASLPQKTIADHADQVQAQARNHIEQIGVTVLEVPEGEMQAAMEYLQNQPGVLAVEPNYIATAQETIPNDPDWGVQYGLNNIGALQGWEYSTGTSWVTIAIIDTGVDRTHPDLILKTQAGYNVLSPGDAPLDDNGHGTHVAGIAAAASNNGIGIAGVSWGAQIMPVKVLNASASGTYADVASGIIWAVANGAQVINLSLGGSAYSAILESAVDYAYNRGVVLVAASGNAGGSSILYPARYTQVIAVGATDSNNQRGAFSNFGNGMELVAPGVSIYSTELGGGYSYRSGTSMAAPFVSGLAAILIGMSGNYDAGLVREQMNNSALDLGEPGWDAYHGYGLIQMDSALKLLFPTPSPSSTATFTPTFRTPMVTATPGYSLLQGEFPTFSQSDLDNATPLASTLTTTITPETVKVLPFFTPTISGTLHDPLNKITPTASPIAPHGDEPKLIGAYLPYLSICLISAGILLLFFTLIMFKAKRR
jgi:thermitase